MIQFRALFSFAVFALLFLVILMGFNYWQDPMCYYRCPKITVEQKTLNSFYQVGQRIFAHPDAEAVIIGSSRGQTTSPIWMQKQMGLKTVNLSAAGADLEAKLTFLRMAQQNLKLKSVIWLTDYFELIPGITDRKLWTTPAVRSFSSKSGSLAGFGWRDLQSLFDHNTLEAAISFMHGHSDYRLSWGPGEGIDEIRCAAKDYVGDVSPQRLVKEVDLTYQDYIAHVLRPKQSEQQWMAFAKQMQDLAHQGIQVRILNTPYHPRFIDRLKVEQPEIFERHQEWNQRLLALQGDHLSVASNWTGIPDDNGSNQYWNDGVHYTCKGVLKMWQPLFAPGGLFRSETR